MAAQVARIVAAPRRRARVAPLNDQSPIMVLPAGCSDKPIPIRLLLADLSSPVNIGAILRTAAVFNVEVGIFDPRGVLNEAAAYQTAMDFSLGLLGNAKTMSDEGQRPFNLGQLGRRKIATVPSGDAVTATGFGFCADDVVIIGNEYDGLPEDFIDRTKTRITIPMPAIDLPKREPFTPIEPRRAGFTANDGACLSASMAAGILCYEAFIASQTR